MLRFVVEVLCGIALLALPVVGAVGWVTRKIRDGRIKKGWQGETLEAVLADLTLQDFGGFTMKVELPGRVQFHCNIEGIAPFSLGLDSRKGALDEFKAGAEEIRLGIPPLDRFFRDRIVNEVTGRRIDASRHRLAPLARFLRRWDTYAELEIRVQGRETLVLMHLDLPDISFPPPAQFRELLVELFVAVRGMYAAATVPPVRSAGEALALLRAETMDATYYLERPGRSPGELTGRSLVEGLRAGNISPLARVAADGEAGWRAVAAREELVDVFDNRPPDELGHAPGRTGALRSGVYGIARALRFVFVQTQIWLVPAVMAWLVLGFCGYELQTQKRVHESKAWPSTPGEIVTSQVHAYKARYCTGGTSSSAGGSSGTKGGGGSSRTCTMVTRYKAVLVYAYTVGGRRYEASRYSVRKRGVKAARKRREAVAFLSPYPSGAKVRVRYNPKTPGDAVLVAGALDAAREASRRKSALYIPLMLATFLLLLLLARFWAWYHRRLPPKTH